MFPDYVKRLEKFSNIQGADGRLSHMARPRYIYERKCCLIWLLCDIKTILIQNNLMSNIKDFESKSSQNLTARYHWNCHFSLWFSFMKSNFPHTRLEECILAFLVWLICTQNTKWAYCFWQFGMAILIVFFELFESNGFYVFSVSKFILMKFVPYFWQEHISV